MVPYFLHYNDVTDRMRPACGGRAAVRFVCFLSFPRDGMGLWVKTTEIPIWCARINIMTHTLHNT